MKSLKEQIEVMTHFMNGGEVEYCYYNNNWLIKNSNIFNWCDFDYRIKEEKKTVIIEKWLCRLSQDGEYRIFETSNINTLHKDWKREKLLETYEVKL